MPRLIKCKSCLLANEVVENMECEEIVSEKTGKITRMYYHKGECWQKRLEHKAFLEIENQQKDSLVEVIMKLHKIEIIPDKFYSTCLVPVREGNYRQGKKVIKYKKGVSYKMLEETYKHCASSIEWARTNRTFESTFYELKYCFAIIIDKIAVVAKKIKKEQYAKQIAEEMSQQYVEHDEHDQQQVVYKKKEVKDFSQYLD